MEEVYEKVKKYYFDNINYTYKNDKELTPKEFCYIVRYEQQMKIRPWNQCHANEILFAFNRECIASLYNKYEPSDFKEAKECNLIDRCHFEKNIYRDENGNEIPILTISPYKEDFEKQKNAYKKTRDIYVLNNIKLFNERGLKFSNELAKDISINYWNCKKIEL